MKHFFVFLLAFALSLNIDSIQESTTHRRELVRLINGNASIPWKAVIQKRFSGKPYSWTKMHCGILKKSDVSEVHNFDSTSITLPDSFDSVYAWPLCPYIGEIRDQSACGSCWAVSAAEVTTDRFCVASNGTITDRVGAADLLECCKTCAPNGGCDGSTLGRVWKYLSQTGIASGGKYGDNSWCDSYPFPPCDHHINGTHGACGAPLIAPMCLWGCDSKSTYKKAYNNDMHRFKSDYSLASTEEGIKKAIYTGGPVQASMLVTTDFEVYSGGIFVHISGSPLGLHAVKIVGWGEENTIPYWRVANSWNEEWGENGFFRIRRGTNENDIESEVYFGTPDI